MLSNIKIIPDIYQLFYESEVANSWFCTLPLPFTISNARSRYYHIKAIRRYKNWYRMFQIK